MSAHTWSLVPPFVPAYADSAWGFASDAGTRRRRKRSAATQRDWIAESFCYVTTRGRRTGRPHQIEIWFGASPTRSNRIYLLSGGGDRSDWVRNVVADSAVQVRIGGREWQGSAAVVTSQDEEVEARHVLAAKYQRWRAGRALSNWARTALPVTIDLSEPVARRP
jgi:deazaflavin-dependent oxidoreductase (nitroreductase family)